MAGDLYYELLNLYAQDSAEGGNPTGMKGRPVDPKSGQGPKPTTPGYLTKGEADALKEEVAGRIDEYTWGTYGPGGTRKLKPLKYTEMTAGHLENVLLTCAGWLKQDQIAAMLICLRKARPE